MTWTDTEIEQLILQRPQLGIALIQLEGSAVDRAAGAGVELGDLDRHVLARVVEPHGQRGAGVVAYREPSAVNVMVVDPARYMRSTEFYTA